METWRLISYAQFDGKTNMAIDEAILEERIKGQVPPTLRLYGFNPPCVTIGLSQKMDDTVQTRIESEGIDVVRRPTGGRAVLHLRDLTYCFVGSDTTGGGGFAANVTQSYKEISQGLVQAFAEMGVATELGATGVAYRHLQDCFMATTGSDLHHQGTKLIGSAQTRRRGGILQHGSVPLDQDPELMPRLLGEASVKDAPRHLNLFHLLGRRLAFEELEAAFKRGFEKAFGVELVVSPLTEAESVAALTVV